MVTLKRQHSDTIARSKTVYLTCPVATLSNFSCGLSLDTLKWRNSEIENFITLFRQSVISCSFLHSLCRIVDTSLNEINNAPYYVLLATALNLSRNRKCKALGNLLISLLSLFNKTFQKFDSLETLYSEFTKESLGWALWRMLYVYSSLGLKLCDFSKFLCYVKLIVVNLLCNFVLFWKIGQSFFFV
jgi:hypothetical protein